MKCVIALRGVGKRYVLGALSPYLTLRESISRAFRRRSSGPSEATGPGSFWALRDVDLSIQEGEVVGIIGPNGAGKSTMLKLLSRITAPTTGRIELQGRVASLLEVGTGFHPELTGRENIFLNGAILGMSKSEILSRFDEIVEFSGVGRFLDTPVKRYSSGMYMRLAFSVAAHVEPEILLVDEVLAVGDAAFQRKCLGKMQNVAQEGRTVVFVSHNMSAIRSLCTRGILLLDGQVAFDGGTAECIDRYLASVRLDSVTDLRSAARRSRSGIGSPFEIQGIAVRYPDGQVLDTRDPLEVTIRFALSEPIDEVVLGLQITSSDNVVIFESRSVQSRGALDIAAGVYQVSCTIPQHSLRPGIYFINVGARSASQHLDYVRQGLAFEVESKQQVESLWLEDLAGLVSVKGIWSSPTKTDFESPAQAPASDVD